MYKSGARAMLPILTGVVPFGLVMGTVAFEAGLSLYECFVMNLFVFAGASQLAAVDLMTQNTAAPVVIATGLIINLRFMLYSAALAPFIQKAAVFKKAFCAYTLTDQAYAALAANQDHLKDMRECLEFYIGATIPMVFCWHISVILGFVFGNFAPESLALEYAVPLSFVALVMPTLKNWNYIIVAAAASVISILLKSIPFNLGLLISSLLCICLGAYLTRKKADA